MPYLYLICAVFFVAADSIFGGLYNKKNAGKRGSSTLYTLLAACSVCLFWTVSFLLKRAWDKQVVWYSLLFAGFYTLCNVSLIRALKTGPVLLTSLFMQLSNIGVTVWGFLFWDTEFSWLVGVGIALVCVAIWLCLYTGKSENAEKDGKISLKWLIFALLAFVGNAGCSITQKTQQMRFDGQYGNFLMMIATAISVLVCFFAWWKDDRSQARELVKGSWYIPVGAGVLNGVLNLCVILLATSYLSPSLIYPVIGVGSLMVTTVFSMLVFKEKMRWWQWIGIVVGAAAVAILSL